MAIVICIAALAAVLITRKDLCEIRIRSGKTEVAVFMDYETK
ncbi:Hok/Gef family protein [Photorhabdus laumondii]